ncbi:MAG TPA: quinone-dependent dihydroorotate dehydrogenase [Candidatus Limnocylindria bacterium]|nr:quinone-dependent dihydroorotate dehydrogenase [Candidatus Limnocylindria bacterium]
MSRWRALAYRAARPLLFGFEPERIHRLTLSGLRAAGTTSIGRGLAGLASGARHDSATPAPLLGLEFRNRVGVGAGFDKDAVALRGWEALGLGFIEVGTVTPLAQGGNPRPRLFRLPSDEALINRMGFNNAGAAALARSVMLARRHLSAGFVVGVNIGRGAATPADQATADYLAAFRLVAPVADYVAINVSSPNTPGLRDLQQPDRLRELLATLRAAGRHERADRPLLVKLAPDLEPDAFAALVAAVADDADGLILSNTTIARDGLALRQQNEQGGLSGRPLRGRMLEAVAHARALLARPGVIIASGGIGSATDVADAYAAGADLVQLWTGLVYHGPGLIGEAVAVRAE